jgi:hypothetical protein
LINPITIDLSGLQKQFNLAAGTIDMLTEVCVKAVTTQIHANWAALAKKTLHSTRTEYLQNLNIIDKGRFVQQIVLSGKLPNMLDQGASPFDMKEGFKKSEKAVKKSVPTYKVTSKGQAIVKDNNKESGWYITIPFRFTTPGSTGEIGSDEMPAEIYKLVLDLNKDEGLKIGNIPDPYNQKLTRQAIYDTEGKTLYNSYEHRNSIYEGLAKKTGVYKKVTQNKYMSFRRVSDNSDPMAWIHKGFVALKLAEKAVENTDVKTIVDNEVKSYLDNILP